MNTRELQDLHSAALYNGSQHQINMAAETPNFRINTAVRDPFAGKNLKHVAQQRDSRMDEALVPR